MSRTRVKFCGMTCAEDAALAARLGADAVGMVFFPDAQTAVDNNAARDIARALPPFVLRTALFVNPSAAEVKSAIDAARPHCLQFHGDETADFCESFGAPYIKAFRVRDAEDIARAKESHPQASGILLDAFCESTPGGSGRSFRWDLAREFGDGRMILAGGLTADNVGEAIRICRPGAVDVSSGISRDDARRRKDFKKMRSFMEAVNNATASDD